MRPRAGPRIRTKLLVISLVLLTLPWLAYRYLEETRQFLYRGQEQAQTLAAQAVATVLHARGDLFTPGTHQSPDSEDSGIFYAYPLAQAVQLDGYADEWGELMSHAKQFGTEAMPSSRSAVGPILAFSLIMGVRDAHLYLFLQVEDDRIVYRHPGYSRLDNSDHIRLSLLDAEGRLRRLLITTDGPGTITAFPMAADWKTPLTESPVRELAGQWEPLHQGYDLELRLPLTLMGPARRFHLAVADVDDAKTRTVIGELGTLPSQSDRQLNHLVLRSRELENILNGLERSGARIWIVDRNQHVRAEAGALRAAHIQDLAVETERRQERSVQQALEGTAAFERRTSADGQGEIIMATYPIQSDEGVLGAVVVEQSTEDILALQRRSLERIGLVTMGTVALIITALMLFASRLAYRIRRLSVEAGAAIDARGRVHQDVLRADRSAGDEFGDLSRNITALLQRLSRYTRFLESMPRMLRHEINNPLNAISTSLQNLTDEAPQVATSRYLNSAERGITRIGGIVNALTEAANLEEALRSEKHARLDLQQLVEGYVAQCRIQYPQRRFESHVDTPPCRILANDFRIEQLLDKLIDNAVDFSPDDGLIEFRLVCESPWVELSISNDGAALPAHLTESLFESMVSGREIDRRGKVHFGMGLFVARTIAEHHGGSVEAQNRDDGRGVTLVLRLPSPTPKKLS